MSQWLHTDVALDAGQPPATLVRGRACLFLDERWIDYSMHVSRMWHQPRKLIDPVIKPELPWEDNGVLVYGTIMKRRELYEAWYVTWTRKPLPRACYARSRDGIHWEKPALGVCDYEGSTQNNILFQGQPPRGFVDDITVHEDPDDAQWPLKAFYWDAGPNSAHHTPEAGIYAARSRDGVHWERLGKVLPAWADRFNVAASKLDGKWVLFGRKPGDLQMTHGRRVWRIESQDMRHWSTPQLVMRPDVFDPPLMEHYAIGAWEYEGLTLGALERMHMSPDRLDTELIWSDDFGVTWKRDPRRPSFIPWGPPQSWDCNWITLSAGTPIVHDCNIWFYYSGRSHCHNVPYPMTWGAIGLAILRRDGFCSIYALEKPGFLRTPLLTWPGGELHINVDPRRDVSGHPTNLALGECVVEIQDESEQPIEGFAAADCVSPRINTYDQPAARAAVTWRNGRSMHELAGRPVRLLFHLRDAHLYSFAAI